MLHHPAIRPHESTAQGINDAGLSAMLHPCGQESRHCRQMHLRELPACRPHDGHYDRQVLANFPLTANMPGLRGAVAQLGERRVRIAKVVGSIPIRSTTRISSKIQESPKPRPKAGFLLGIGAREDRQSRFRGTTQPADTGSLETTARPSFCSTRPGGYTAMPTRLSALLHAWHAGSVTVRKRKHVGQLAALLMPVNDAGVGVIEALAGKS
jgi:hypothetical protein